jgi:hypothetical protein
LSGLRAPQATATGEILPINNGATAAAGRRHGLAPTDYPCQAHGEW